jgi:hypothetical protein
MNKPDDSGFVKRGFLMLGAMTLLVLVVLGIILYRPTQVMPTVPADLPAEASKPGWQIRYNATVALARRGSDKVPWNVLHEMLDEKQQLKNSPILLPDGREVPDEATARGFVITGLKAVAEWHQKQTAKQVKPEVTAAMKEVYAQVDRLAASPIVELQIRAKRTQESLIR